MNRRTDRKSLGLWAAFEDDDKDTPALAPPAGRSSGDDGRQAMTALVRLAKLVERAARRDPEPESIRSGGSGLRPPELSSAQRVVVKISYAKHAPTKPRRGKGGSSALKAHLRYIQRDGVSEDAERGQLYDGEHDALDGIESVNEWEHDPHHFRVILSPDNGHAIGEFNAFVRSVMSRVETELGGKLTWAAVNHYNTDNPHAHVVIRGRTQSGQVLRLPREFVKQGFRTIAQAVATEMLGLRRTRELVESAARDVWQSRLTGLDRILLRAAKDGRMEFRRKLSPFTEPYRQLLHARLQQLERLELARRLAPDGAQWELKPDLVARLRTLGERQDIIKTLHQAAGRQAYAAGELTAGTIDDRRTYRVMASGRLNEGRGDSFVVLEGPDGAISYARRVRVGGRGESLERGTTVRASLGSDGRITLSRSREAQRKVAPGVGSGQRRRRPRGARV